MTFEFWIVLVLAWLCGMLGHFCAKSEVTRPLQDTTCEKDAWYRIGTVLGWEKYLPDDFFLETWSAFLKRFDYEPDKILFFKNALTIIKRYPQKLYSIMKPGFGSFDRTMNRHDLLLCNVLILKCLYPFPLYYHESKCLGTYIYLKFLHIYYV